MWVLKLLLVPLPLHINRIVNLILPGQLWWETHTGQTCNKFYCCSQWQILKPWKHIESISQHIYVLKYVLIYTPLHLQWGFMEIPCGYLVMLCYCVMQEVYVSSDLCTVLNLYVSSYLTAINNYWVDSMLIPFVGFVSHTQCYHCTFQIGPVLQLFQVHIVKQVATCWRCDETGYFSPPHSKMGLLCVLLYCFCTLVKLNYCGASC